MSYGTVPDPEAMRKMWNDHVEDCSPGEVQNMGVLMERDPEGVQAIYKWLHQSLAEMVVATPFDTPELLTLIRFMTGGVGYFINGKCLCCGETICEEMERMHREQFIKHTASSPAHGSPVRSEGDQPVAGEGDCSHT